ncbi:MAG TPA: trypsin-like peptidase domain-containing protein, partial [Candidatus Limnocylindrales bacterium]
MNDEPVSDAPQGGGQPDPLDDTQRVEVPRYAPTPDPRPDARWAWATSGEQAAPSPWQDPATRPAGTPSAPVGDYGTGAASQPGSAGPWDTMPGNAGSTSPGWGPPAQVETAPVVPTRRRGGAGIGTIVTVSVLSAVLASGGTVLLLDRTGAFEKSAPASTIGSGQQTGSKLPVTIDESSAVIDAAAKVGPAVVKIDTEGSGSDPFQQATQGVGSGVIYDPNGWILTNRHVIADAAKLTVDLRDGRSFPGTVYGIDTLTDLAIVKIDQTGLPTAPIGHSDGLKVGQLVIAIGSPLGMYSFSVTSGIVSGKGRTVTVDDGKRISNLIQTDAAINPGNSGGPLLNMRGEVVGINSAINPQANTIGFAIPSNLVKSLLTQLREKGHVTRGWLGVTLQTVTPELQKAFE